MLLLFPPGLDFAAAFFGCLYAGVVGIPAFPPRPHRGLSRILGMREDSGAALVLSTRRAADIASAPGNLHARWASLPRLAIEDVDPAAADGWDGPPAGLDDIAYLQYTSGSTSEPRGVVVTHGNLLYNCAYMREVFSLSPDTFAVTWAPHFHDMGLVEGLLNPIYSGYPTLLMAPAQFVARPIRWLQAITRHRATHTGGPNFAYDLCVRTVRPEQREELDLSSLENAYCGAEPVRRATLDRFATYFASCGFRPEAFHPAYGLAESTLMVTGGTTSAPPVFRNVSRTSRPRVLVGCGRVRRETTVAIVDPETRRRRPDGAEGEIWVSGPTVAGGYWNRPVETRETFQALIADTGEGPFLRTGDLGLVDEAELFVTGRLKDLIIVHGANLYPQDLEWAAGEADEALRGESCAAFSVDAEDDERIVIAHEVARRHRDASRARLEEIAGAVRLAVAQAFDVEVYVVQLLRVGSLPKTSSGKVRRQACRSEFLAGRLETLWDSRPAHAGAADVPEVPLARARLVAMAPRERGLVLEKHLRRQVARGLRLHWRQVDPRRGLFSYGLESLRGRELIAELEDSLDLKLSSSTLFNYPSIAELGAHLLRLLRIDPAPAGDRTGTDEERGTP